MTHVATTPRPLQGPSFDSNPPAAATALHAGEHRVIDTEARRMLSAGAGSVGLGGLTQLDFLVVAFLQGNDYLPKLRGAQLHRMWLKLLKLVRRLLTAALCLPFYAP